MRYRFFKQSCDLILVTWSKSHVWEPLTQVSTLPSVVSIHIMQVEICILFVTWPHKTTPLDVMHIYWWKLHATTLKSLVIIGILIVKRKNASSKTRIFSLSNSRRHLANVDMKSKIILSRRQFFADVIFLPLRKFRTIKKKLEKNSYTQTNVCLLHISRNFKDIFKYICFTFYLQQTVNHWESAIIFIDRCCLPFFFSADIRSNQFRKDLII